MRYLDANVFIHAFVDDGPKGDTARDVLNRLVGRGAEGAVTATLTVDEVVWKLMRLSSRDHALQEARWMMELSSLTLLPVDGTDVLHAVGLMEDHPGLSPRDAIHAACALNAGVFTVVSDDPDFDDVAGLDRESLR